MNNEKDQLIQNANFIIEKKLGISYEEFKKLDFDDQQRLIKEYHKKNPSNDSGTTMVMIGSGEHAMFKEVKKGEKVMINNGNFINAGLSLEQSKTKRLKKVM